MYTAAKTTRCQPYWRRLLRWPEHCMFEGSSSGISGKLRTQRNRSGDCVWTLNHNLSSHKKTIISREKPGPINLSESWWPNFFGSKASTHVDVRLYSKLHGLNFVPSVLQNDQLQSDKSSHRRIHPRTKVRIVGIDTNQCSLAGVWITRKNPD